MNASFISGNVGTFESLPPRAIIPPSTTAVVATPRRKPGWLARGVAGVDF